MLNYNIETVKGEKLISRFEQLKSVIQIIILQSLITFPAPFLQRFIMILSEHLVRCDTDGIDYKTPWYQWTVGRLQQIFMMVIISFGLTKQ